LTQTPLIERLRRQLLLLESLLLEFLLLKLLLPFQVGLLLKIELLLALVFNPFGGLFQLATLDLRLFLQILLLFESLLKCSIAL
jgi:hypothetical protein